MVSWHVDMKMKYDQIFIYGVFIFCLVAGNKSRSWCSWCWYSRRCRQDRKFYARKELVIVHWCPFWKSHNTSVHFHLFVFRYSFCFVSVISSLKVEWCHIHVYLLCIIVESQPKFRHSILKVLLSNLCDKLAVLIFGLQDYLYLTFINFVTN